jgi:HlyD family secretion protein
MKAIGTGGWMGIAAALLLAGCAQENSGTFQGYAEGEYVDVATAEAGRLDRLAAEKGKMVEAGAPLFALEAEREEAALRQAREQQAAAESLLADLQTGKRPPELAVIRAQLDQARAEARRAETERVRDEAQLRTGGIAQAQLDRSQAAAETSAAKVRELERQLDVAGLPAREDQIAAQQAQAAAARAAVEQAEWRLGQKTVVAPVAGRVIDTLYEAGEWVAAGRPVVRLLPPEGVKIRFYVPETARGGLALGQTVAVRCDGRAEEIAAEITFLAEEAEYTPPVIYSNETRAKLVYRVEARPRGAAGLHPGQPVEVILR